MNAVTTKTLVLQAFAWCGFGVMAYFVGKYIGPYPKPWKLVIAAAIMLAGVVLYAAAARHAIEAELRLQAPVARRMLSAGTSSPTWAEWLGVLLLCLMAAFAGGYAYAYFKPWLFVVAAGGMWLGIHYFEPLLRRRLLARQLERDASQLPAQAQEALDMLESAVLLHVHKLVRTLPHADEQAAALVGAVGALAGYACQAHLRRRVTQSGLPPDAGFVDVRAGAERFYFGDALNDVLLQGKGSLWGRIESTATKLGHVDLPDKHALFKHIAGSVGTSEFGVPRWRSKRGQAVQPAELLAKLWDPVIQEVSRAFPEPHGWAIVLIGVAETALHVASQRLGVAAATLILLESAIAMSKVDLVRTQARYRAAEKTQREN